MSHELSLQYWLSHPFQSLRNQNEEQDIEKDETGVDINDEPPIPPLRRSTHKKRGTDGAWSRRRLFTESPANKS